MDATYHFGIVMALCQRTRLLSVVHGGCGVLTVKIEHDNTGIKSVASPYIVILKGKGLAFIAGGRKRWKNMVIHAQQKKMRYSDPGWSSVTTRRTQKESA